MTDSVSKAFKRAWAKAENTSWVKGLLGKPDGTIAVPGRSGHVYVRISSEGVLTLTTARVVGTIPTRAHLPVRMRLEPGAGYVIRELDPTRYEAATSSDTPTTSGVPAHTHALDSGQSYMVEAQRLEPGLVHSAGGWLVTVESFRYYYDSTWQTYAGGTVALAGNKPATTGKHRLVVICLDPSTNSATAVNGSDEDYATALTQADIDDISIGDTYPLGAVIIRNDDSSLEDQDKYIDARGWLNYASSVSFDDSEGDPEAVTDTAADGTSDYAARRDHVHAYAFDNSIGNPAEVNTSGNLGSSDWPARRDHVHALSDNVVTDAKLRDSAALSVIGRSANSSGDPADIAATATSDAVLRESGGTVAFGEVATGGLADGAVTNAKAANMAQSTIKGRAAGAGSGAPQDLTVAQVFGTIGGVLHFNINGDGNVGTGEDTLATYTIAANTLLAYATLHFEITGNWGGNANSKRLRVYFGGNVILDHTTTNASEFWTVQGRVACVGDASQKIWAHFFSDTERDYQHNEETVDATSSIVFSVTGEATLDDDIEVETVLLTWTASFTP